MREIWLKVECQCTCWIRFNAPRRVDDPAAHRHFGGNARTETRDHAGSAWHRGVFVEEPAQRVEHDRAGDIAVFGQGRPAVAEHITIDAEELAQAIKDSRAPGGD